jgi:VanZ family protein
MPPKALLAWFWTLVILFLCWIPRFYLGNGENHPKPIFIPNFDKLVHMGIFAIFAVLWMRVGSSSRRGRWVFGAGLALAVITELGQLTPIVNRDCNVPDGLADTFGLVIGLFAFEWARKLAEKRTVRAEA